ncbi:MAG: di-trans,poly-cis-decaprenylcistransferase [Nanoarchaeota archaeon]|nr:di-trans,poly-cis-decaprenylcistransferase [Nanoarchaeota archaeon]MBU1270053.1 di-trans,poly-cis-decaprenylcistransferase [Nanoarchaeota archaeon]MBU1604253.1 di-trans,poly-cis-decaprenylcistransferase [Nanoarchaeota archaeon]MBU2443789.1 di-trans,poly-cis-decaprenylcistransferase [Nanoarchaeota archaeon]
MMKGTDNPVPRHIGVVLDGNRRFAKKLMLKPWKGHEWGAKKVENLLNWAKDLGIKELTIYSFSIQNMNRPKEEFNFLMNLFKKEFTRLLHDKRIMKDGIRINIIGRIQLLPKDLYELFQELMEKTKDNKEYIINFAIAYGGREEVIDAIMKLGADLKSGKLDVNKINEEVFQNYLYTPDEPDLIIRTGGDRRTSNFLIWQSNYSEWFFLEKTWPEFEKEDLIRIVEDFQNRERRFGK